MLWRVNLINENNKLSPTQLILSQACEGSIVTTRELVKTLSLSDLAALREGDLTVDDLKEIVLDIASQKEATSQAKQLTEDDDHLL